MFEELIQYNAAPKPEKRQTEEEEKLECRRAVHFVTPNSTLTG